MRLFLLLPAALVCLAQAPTDFQGWLDQGVRAFKGARYPEAVSAFQRAVDLNPSSINARLYLGTAYMQQYVPGDERPENRSVAERAESEFRHLLALQPDNRVASTSVASLQLNMKRFDEARESYRRILQADPNNKEAHYTIGYIAWAQWYPAHSAARQMLGMRPEAPGPIPDPAVRTELRSRWWQVLDDGIWNLTRALEIDPRHDDAMAYMNLLIRERADLRDTAAEFQRDVVIADEWVQKALATKREKAQQFSSRTSTGALVRPAQPEGPRIRVESAVAQQYLVSQIQPVYPPLAVQARIQGKVRFDAIIGKDGRVVNMTVQSGHPLLVPAAIEAVKQWVYRPTILNGNPVEVVTNVEVPFTLSN